MQNKKKSNGVINHNSSRSINNRNAIGKIKEFLQWNRVEYPISQTTSTDGTPTRPPRRKRTSRNSVAPSESSEIKVINAATPMHINDIESAEDERLKERENHIWREKAIILKLNANEFPAPYYNIPYAIPYVEWL